MSPSTNCGIGGTQQAGLATLRTEVERLQGAVDRLMALIETKSSDNPQLVKALF